MASETLARLKTLGMQAMLPMELLAFAVSKSDDEVDRWLGVSREMMLAGRKLRKFADLSADELQRAFDLDEPTAKRLVAMFTLGRKVGVAGKGELEIETITDPQDVADLLDDLRHERQEHFVAIYLDSKSVILRVATIHIGTANASIVGLREIFREAVREGAVSLIVAHNHPSGDPEPSTEDIEVTAKIKEAGQLLDIQLLDHVIIGERRFVSLNRQKLM
ncbi:MAG: DNA repair protein RadC [Armatimonadota bacterium]